MSAIRLSVETQRDAQSMIGFLNTEVLSRSDVSTLLAVHRWEGSVLHASGSLGSGTISVGDFIVEVDIVLSAMGSAARSIIERKLIVLLSAEPTDQPPY
jgi:hypothetical protein